MLIDHRHYLAWLKILKARPAEVGVGTTLFVRALRENSTLDGDAKGLCLVFFERLKLVEPLNEQEIRDLFDDGERIGDAARPEGIPDFVDLVADFAGKHEV